MLAESSTYKNRHGAVVVSGGRVIGTGVNKRRNHPDWVDSPTTQAGIHAEMAALRDCGNTPIAGGTIYVGRMGRNGFPLMSKPCKNCQRALREAGIRKIVYTIDSSMEL